MAFDVKIPLISGEVLPLELSPGTSTIFVGANGGGKTRLAVYLETSLGDVAHRISAHRALSLNAAVPKIREEEANRGLRYGNTGRGVVVAHRHGNRWGSKEAVALLNDFDHLLQVLFADQARKALATHKAARGGTLGEVTLTKLEVLSEIWSRLLPPRELLLIGDDIQVKTAHSPEPYSSSDLSDGERSIFYLIGQALAAADNSVLIIDEPELHIHPSIMSKLWDELEAARPDCAFVFITHDLEFSARRVARKLVLKGYAPGPSWEVLPIPDHAGFDEETCTLILGSRRPVLFTEGREGGLDSAIYRGCFPEFTVIPRESCEDVIHSVTTMRNNPELTRITCAGVVDADHRSAEERAALLRLGIAVLPVAEIENMLLLPSVAEELCKLDSCNHEEATKRIAAMSLSVVHKLSRPEQQSELVSRMLRRRMTRLFGGLDLSGCSTADEMSEFVRQQAQSLNLAEEEGRIRGEIEADVKSGSLEKILAYYDNKGLIADAASKLRNTNGDAFISWIARLFRGDGGKELTALLRSLIPVLEVR